MAVQRRRGIVTEREHCFTHCVSLGLMVVRHYAMAIFNHHCVPKLQRHSTLARSCGGVDFGLARIMLLLTKAWTNGEAGDSV
ncbi:MAG: hypothetical protein ABIN96_06265 [Rubrivivax sp.]